MANGALHRALTRPFKLETSAGLPAYRCAAIGSARNSCVIGTASLPFLGVNGPQPGAENDDVSLTMAGVGRFAAHGAIAVKTGSNPTRLVMAAAGRVDKLPTAPGTYYQVGWVDPSSPAAAAQDDGLWAVIDPREVVIPALPVHQGPFADMGAEASKTLWFGVVPTGRVWTLDRVLVNNGTATLATVDVQIDGTTNLSAPVDLTTSTVTEVLGTAMLSQTVAAGEALTVDLATGAATGDLDAPEVLLLYSDTEA